MAGAAIGRRPDQDNGSSSEAGEFFTALVSAQNVFLDTVVFSRRNEISSLFRARLQTLLSVRGVSQRQVSLATGLSQQTVNNYLRAVSKLPSAHELLALSRYFDVPMEYFVTSDGKTVAGTNTGKAPRTPSAVPASEVRRAAQQMNTYAEKLRLEAERLLRLSGGD